MSELKDELEDCPAYQCVDCEDWYDENYLGVCGDCDEPVCPKCVSGHKCRGLEEEV